MVDNSIIQSLMFTGLSEYEARVYLALLRKNPSTAYEAARAAGISTSKIYEVMARLESKGMAAAHGDDKKRYVPQSPEEFLDTSRQLMDHTIGTLRHDLMDVAKSETVSHVWNVSGYEAVMNKAMRMVASVESELLLSVWREDAAALAAGIREAAARGVRIACIHFGQPEIRAGTIFTHPIADTLYHEKGGRALVVVADSREALLATVGGQGGDAWGEGAFSANRGFANLAEDYIKHDIYVMKIVKRFDPVLMQRFGRRYEKLRNVFADEENI